MKTSGGSSSIAKLRGREFSKDCNYIQKKGCGVWVCNAVAIFAITSENQKSNKFFHPLNVFEEAKNYEHQVFRPPITSNNV